MLRRGEVGSIGGGGAGGSHDVSPTYDTLRWQSPTAVASAVNWSHTFATGDGEELFECPVGCGSYLPASALNPHLDTCLEQRD